MIVRIEEDVVADVPDVHSASTASIRAARLPAAVQGPLQRLREQRQIKEIVPVFARAAPDLGRARATASVAAAFARSVRGSENEDLRGINLLRLSQSADLAEIEKELDALPGIVYSERVPARWIARAPAASSADPLVNRQWGPRAIRWFDVDPLPDAAGVNLGVLDTGIDVTHPEPAQVLTRLTESATRLPAMGGQRRTHAYGAGLLNLQRALRSA